MSRALLQVDWRTCHNLSELKAIINNWAKWLLDLLMKSRSYMLLCVRHGAHTKSASRASFGSPSDPFEVEFLSVFPFALFLERELESRERRAERRLSHYHFPIPLEGHLTGKSFLCPHSGWYVGWSWSLRVETSRHSSQCNFLKSSEMNCFDFNHSKQ